jgi:hypothetical protein
MPRTPSLRGRYHVPRCGLTLRNPACSCVRWEGTGVAGLRTSGVVAPFALNGPINRAAFEAYVEKVLVPELRRVTW